MDEGSMRQKPIFLTAYHDRSEKRTIRPLLRKWGLSARLLSNAAREVLPRELWESGRYDSVALIEISLDDYSLSYVELGLSCGLLPLLCSFLSIPELQVPSGERLGLISATRRSSSRPMQVEGQSGSISPLIFEPPFMLEARAR